MYPDDYLYTKEHEWLKIADDVYTLGITTYAQKELGEVVFVDLPEVGATFEAEDEIGTIESVKAVAEVYAPISGEVIEVNERLEDEPELMNDNPHEAGWICKVRFDAANKVDDLMKADAYASFTSSD